MRIETVGENKRHGDRRHNHQIPAHDGDHCQKQQRKRHIDQQRHGRRGNQIAHRFKILQLLGRRPHGLGAFAHLGRLHLLKQDRRQHDIALLPRQIEEIGAQHAHQEVENIGDGDTDGKGPQRIQRIVGDDPVIDIAGK